MEPKPMTVDGEIVCAGKACPAFKETAGMNDECYAEMAFGEWIEEGEPCVPGMKARLAALEAENERLRGEDAGADINIRELWARVQSAESALVAAREDYQRQVAHVATMFDELKHLAVEAGWDANEDLSSPMQFVRQFVRTGLVPQAGRIKEEMADLRAALVAAREECERLRFQADKGHRMVERLESELAALRARADDAGRVGIHPLPNGDVEFRFHADEYIVGFVLSENPRNVCWNKKDTDGHAEGGVIDAAAMKELLRLARAVKNSSEDGRV